MNDRSIRQLAVSISLIVFALVKFYEGHLPEYVAFVVPGVMSATRDATATAQLLGAAWSGIKLGILIVGLEHGLYRIFGRRFLGRWAYVSSSGNFAIVDMVSRGFWAGGVALGYSVSLFKTAKEVADALQGQGTSSPFGTADGLLTGFKDDKITVIY